MNIYNGNAVICLDSSELIQTQTRKHVFVSITDEMWIVISKMKTVDLDEPPELIGTCLTFQILTVAYAVGLHHRQDHQLTVQVHNKP